MKMIENRCRENEVVPDKEEKSAVQSYYDNDYSSGSTPIDIDMPGLDIETPTPCFPCISQPVYGPCLPSESIPQNICIGDVRDPSAERGLAGLRNLGNTCFMNAGMQCLLSNPCIIKYFLEDFQLNESSRHTLTGKFAEVMQKFWSGSFSLIHPNKFKEVVGLYHPQFQDYRQHDCQEFLALLLDSLHEHLNVGHPSHKTCTFSDTDTEDGVSSKDCLGAVVRSDIKESEKFSPDCASTAGQSLEIDNQLVTVDPDDDRCNKHTMILNCTNQLQYVSEDSNVSEPSHVSTDSLISDLGQVVMNRMESIPDEIKTQGIKVIEVGNFTAEVTGILGFDDMMDIGERDDAVPDGHRKLPSIEDICMKDTKTLNTNVLATGYMHEVIATDSEKFHKPENTNRSLSSPVSLLEDANSFVPLSDLMACDTSKEDFKPVKDTNLMANICDKFGEDGSYGKKMLFSELECPEDYSKYNINNIKRIKIDEEEKNMRMQSKLKVNTEQNQTKDVERQIKTGIVAQSGSGDHLFRGLTVTTDHPVAHSVGWTGGTMSFLNNEDQFWMQHIRIAEKSWLAYLSQNKSVIVDTFQGQFKSTVICSECHHISVTFEPFMYLSVPLPHALERQISIIFVPCDNKQPIRYLVTVNKQANVKKLRSELLRHIGEESCDLVISEVFDNHVARVLEDNMTLKFVNDSTRTIYAFEILPPPQVDDLVQSTENLVCSSSKTNNNATAPSSTELKESSSQTLIDKTESSSHVEDLLEIFNPAVDNNTAGDGALNNSCELVGVQQDSRLESNPDINWQHNELANFGQVDDNVLGTNVWKTNTGNTSNIVWGTAEDQGEGWIPSSQNKSGTSPGFQKDDYEFKQNSEETTNGVDETESEDKIAADQWKSCAICLDEMVDSDLLIHPPCGGTLCHNCLEMSFKHYCNGLFMCPVCSTDVNPTEDFIQLNCMANYKPKTRILSVPIMYRLDAVNEDGEKTLKLFGHPNILYLPSKITGELLYKTVDRVVPISASYSIILTDGQGYRCSRCLYTQHCSGCEMAREGQVNLQPGDHLAVRFSDLIPMHLETADRYIDDKSMDQLRLSSPLTLFDCFRAFTESEVLDEHNPWFCPKCRKNQCANKTMTVWRYPDTLVVYLKRFVYHELSSTKIDTDVVFSLEDLDLSNYISGPNASALLYDLQSCVCHFGGANSGHYTAYAKHPIKKEWYYYNDETCIKQAPQDADYSHAYILFYQRKGSAVEFNLPSKLRFDDEMDMGCLTASLQMGMAAYPASSARHNSFDESNSDQYNSNEPNAQSSQTNFDFYS